MLSKANASSANKEHATRPTVRLVGAECSADESERWKKLKTSSFELYTSIRQVFGRIATGTCTGRWDARGCTVPGID